LIPIAQNTEKFMAMSASYLVERPHDDKPVYVTVQFRDSYQILSESLAVLVKNAGYDAIIQTKKMRTIYGVSDATICSKGIFPYMFFDSFEKLHHSVLPEYNEFEKISPEDYERAQISWN